MWTWSPYDSAATVPPQVQAVLDRIVQRSMGYQATLQVIGGLQLLFDPAYLSRPDVQRVVPPALLAWYRSDEAQWYKRTMMAVGASEADVASLSAEVPVEAAESWSLRSAAKAMCQLAPRRRRP